MNRATGSLVKSLPALAAAVISLLFSAHLFAAACPISAPQNVTFTYNGPTSHCGFQARNLCNPEELVKFTASAFSYTFTDCDQFSWDFGDGSMPVSTENPSHAFSAAGSYTVLLRVTNSMGMSTAEFVVTVGEVLAPLVEFFRPEFPVIEKGQTSSLEWSFTGVSGGSIMSCTGGTGCSMLSAVTRQAGSLDVHPTASTMYQLVLSSDATAITFVQVAGGGTGPTGSTVGTSAGTHGQAGHADGGIGTGQFNHPTAVALDPTSYVDSFGVTHDGDQVVIDGSNNTVRRVTAAGTIETIAGHAGLAGYVGGDGTAARFDFTGSASQPAGGVAVDAEGNIFVADSANHVIKEIDRRNNVTIYAGAPTLMGYQDGSRLSALFFFPTNLAFGADGTLYIADTGNSVIRAIRNDVVTTFAGQAGAGGFADGAAGSALFTLPHGLAVDPAGTVYVSELNVNRLRRISGGMVTTFAGSSFGAEKLGVEAINPFNFGSGGGLAFIGGYLYVANTNNQTVLTVGTGAPPALVAGRVVSAGFADGVGSKAQFNSPNALGVTSDGYLTVVDTQNHVLRKAFLPRELRRHTITR